MKEHPKIARMDACLYLLWYCLSATETVPSTPIFILQKLFLPLLYIYNIRLSFFLCVCTKLYLSGSTHVCPLCLFYTIAQHRWSGAMNSRHSFLDKHKQQPEANNAIWLFVRIALHFFFFFQMWRSTFLVYITTVVLVCDLRCVWMKLAMAPWFDTMWNIYELNELHFLDIFVNVLVLHSHLI